LRRCTQRLYRDDDCGGWVLTQAGERLMMNRGWGKFGGAVRLGVRDSERAGGDGAEMAPGAVGSGG